MILADGVRYIALEILPVPEIIHTMKTYFYFIYYYFLRKFGYTTQHAGS